MQEAAGSDTTALVLFPAPKEPAVTGLRSLETPLETIALGPSAPAEAGLLRRFVCTARNKAQYSGIDDNWSLPHIAEAAELDLEAIHRESALGLTIWIAWLQVTAEFTPRCQLKYQCLAEFLAVYECFVDYETEKQQTLMHVANWMGYLLRKIPARKNKGFVLQVIPKLVEGWNVRYITGSGQSKATEDRVKIYETEGDVVPLQRLKPAKRGRMKKKRGSGKASTTKRRRSDSEQCASEYSTWFPRASPAPSTSSTSSTSSASSSIASFRSPSYSTTPSTTPVFKRIRTSTTPPVFSDACVHMCNDFYEQNLHTEYYFTPVDRRHTTSPGDIPCSDGATTIESFDAEPGFACVIDKDLFDDGFPDLEFAGLAGKLTDADLPLCW